MDTNKLAGLFYICMLKRGTVFSQILMFTLASVSVIPPVKVAFQTVRICILRRRYNGEWIPADGNLPFNLDGWVSSGNGVEYDGSLTAAALLSKHGKACLRI